MSCKADIVEAEFGSALQQNPIHFITTRIKYVLWKGFSKLKYALKLPFSIHLLLFLSPHYQKVKSTKV